MKYNSSSLGPELEKRAKEELNEDPKRRDEDIKYIREWISKQPHLTARTDDWTILRFLRGCKFSLERTKEKMNMYYTCKTLVPEWFTQRDPMAKDIHEILEMGLVLPLTGNDFLGRSVVISRFGMNDPHKYPLDIVMKVFYMILDVFMEEDENLSIAGATNIIDAHGFTSSHFLQMTPPIMKKMMTIGQDGYPMRPKGLHYIYTSSGFDAMINIAKKFMKEKLKKRIHMHGKNIDNLYKYFPMNILPTEYGGTNGSVQDLIDYWIERVEARRDWLMEDEHFGVDESKRPGKPKTSSDLFGLEGSFRKINVD